MSNLHPEALVALTADIVASYVAGQHLAAEKLPDVITAVHGALVALGTPAAAPEPEVAKPSPAEIRKSISPDALTSFVDGKPYKSLKRHLTAHGLTPDGYRTRYGLPPDYPMASPNYSAARSALAKGIGLGQKRAAA